MNGYQQQSLAGATGIDLVVALYDGVLRYLYRAVQCVEEDDVYGRRMAVKRVTDILIYLQSTLRTDVRRNSAKRSGSTLCRFRIGFMIQPFAFFTCVSARAVAWR